MSARNFELFGKCRRFGNVTVNRVTDKGNLVAINVLLHGNSVAHIQNGVLYLSSCGWRTNTTKTVINNVLKQLGCGNMGIVQKKFVWYFDGMPFEDGMQINLRAYPIEVQSRQAA